MKKIISILSLSLFLMACTSQSPTQPTSLQENYPYLEPTSLVLSGPVGCFFDKVTQAAKPFDCENLGEASLGMAKNMKVEVLPVSSTDASQVYLSFVSDAGPLDVPQKLFDSMIDTNSDWFNLEVTFLDSDNIYVWNRSGHEGANNGLSFYNGVEWKDLDLVTAVRNHLLVAARDIDFAIVDLKVSFEHVKAGVRMGEGYGNTVNYELIFDREDLNFLQITEKTPIEASVSTEEGLYFVHDVKEIDDEVGFTVESLQWFGYEEGIEAAMEDTGCPREKITWGDCAPSLNNGVYTRLSGEKEVLPLDTNADIQVFVFGSAEEREELSAEEFVTHWNSYEDYSSPPYHLRIENGEIVEVVEQYVP